MAGKIEVLRRANELLSEVSPDSKLLKSAHFDAIFKAIHDMVRDGERVSVQHFGTFVRAQRAARRGWDSAKNEPTHIPPSVRLVFRSKVCFETERENAS